MNSKHFYTFISTFFLFIFQESLAQEILPRRAADPVVLTGAALSDLEGEDIAAIAAFRYSKEQAWVNIPVQVDERDSVTAARIYGDVEPVSCFNDAWCSNLHLLKILTYSDANTFTGADSDPTFDANDELVFMAKDAGVEATDADAPQAVLPGSGLEIQLTDPVDNSVGYVYLFLIDPKNTGKSFKRTEPYVTYDFNLISGDYKRSFSKEMGPNPERSVVTTGFFEIGFSDRWIKDELRLKSGGASGVDILDRQKVLFAPDVCERHELTFSYGEGAFIVNKSGPVRAIRAYMGANSGPLTQREHIFYEQQEEINTWLRVHPIQGIMDFYDYSEDATGMVYSNNNNPAGVTVDGKRDRLVEGKLNWELLTGSQGTLFMQHTFQVHLSAQGVTSYYLDDENPDVPQCTGDNFAFGSSGIMIKSPISNTDIRINPRAPDFKLKRVSYFYGPDQKIDIPELQTENRANPVEVQVTNYRAEEEGLQVYPNPFGERLFVVAKGKARIKEVSIWNMVGGLVHQESFLRAARFQLNTSNLSAGVYVLQVTDDSGERKKMRLIKSL